MKKSKVFLSLSLLFVLISSLIIFSTSLEAKNEEETKIVELTDYSIQGFYAFDLDNAADVYETSSKNQFLRLSDKGKEYSSLYFESEEFINANGLYRIEMDLRPSNTFESENIFIALMVESLAQPIAWSIANSKEALEAQTTLISGSDFRHLVFDFEVNDFYSHFYKYFKIGYQTSDNSEGFLDIDNITIAKGSGMSFDETVNLDASQPGDFSNFTNNIYTGDFQIAEENGNHFLLISSEKDSQSVKKKISEEANEARNFRLEMKIKKSSLFSGTLKVSLPNGNISSTEIDLSSVNESWSLVTFAFKPSPNSNKEAYLIFTFESEQHNENNFLAIDDIKIIRVSTEANIDNQYNGDLEGSVALLDNPGWTSDNLYYIPDKDTGNSIINDNSNQVLKLYTESGSDTSITKRVDKINLSKAGWYEIAFDVKGGEDFFIENLGFRLQSSDQVGYHSNEVVIDSSSINSSNYKTIKASFYVNKDSASEWINLDLWVFTRNDDSSHYSKENYILIDNIAFYRLSSETSFGLNLFPDGKILGFSSQMGRKVREIISLDEYSYQRDLIKKDFLTQFDQNTKLTQVFKNSHYLGTIDIDIPPLFQDEGDYHYFKLVYDGKSLVKNFSSTTYLLHDFDFTTKNLYELSFDYKENFTDTDIIRVAFVSNDNDDDFMLDLYEAQIGNNLTKGINRETLTYVVSDNGDGWYHLSLIFEPNIEFKTRVNSIRFLLSTNFNEENWLCISNLELVEHSKTQMNTLIDSFLSEPSCEEIYITPYILIAVAALTLIITTSVVIVLIKKRKGEHYGKA